MNGQYPMLTSVPAGDTVKHWVEFVSRIRWWDVEPFYDVSAGRALALELPPEDIVYDKPEGVEYIVYLEKPGPVEVTVQRHSYNVYWFDPASGNLVKEKKEFKGLLFQGQPPDTSKPWVLHLSRDGKKEGMLRNEKFESRRPTVQEVEANPTKIPYELAEPTARDLPAGRPVKYSIRLTRETKASKAMLYLLTGEVVRDAQGARVLATGKDGTFTIPPSILKQYPGTMVLRIYGLNGVGKLYQADMLVTVTEP